MSLELIPGNDLMGHAPKFDRHEILSTVTFTEQQRTDATSYLSKHAPDLMGMILGAAA